MLHRVASLMLILLTVSFFVLHWVEENEAQPTITNEIFPQKQDTNTIARDEYLILMESGQAKRLPEVLKSFDLTLLAPLGEWAYVAKTSKRAEIITLDSLAGLEEQRMAAMLEAHEAVQIATLNYIQSDDSCAFSCGFDKERSAINSDELIVPHDPLYKFQWHLSEKNGINLPAAWRITTGSSATIIALVDRNFILEGDDLTPDRCNSRHFYVENVLDYFIGPHVQSSDGAHGTNVLSVLAPCTNNGSGLAGIDWHAQVFAVDTRSDRSLATRMFGIMWAAGIDVCKSSLFACPSNSEFQRNSHPANIINASFGFTGPYLQAPPYGPVLDIIGWINRERRIIVASAGNEASLADRRLPGAAGGVISVGASNRFHESSPFSNFGRTVDVLGPGEEIIGLTKNSVVRLNGTSFSSPIVSGVVALMLSVDPRLVWKQAEYILKKTAEPLNCKQYCPDTMEEESQALCKQTCCIGERTICASGIIDAGRAVKMAYDGIPPTALVDVDDYYLPLSEHNNMRANIQVKNWGKKRARVRQRPGQRHLKISPEVFEVPQLGPAGEPGTKDIQVYFDGAVDRELVLSLILEAGDYDQKRYSDRIEAIVEITPDKIVNKKLYRELF